MLFSKSGTKEGEFPSKLEQEGSFSHYEGRRQCVGYFASIIWENYEYEREVKVTGIAVIAGKKRNIIRDKELVYM